MYWLIATLALGTLFTDGLGSATVSQQAQSKSVALPEFCAVEPKQKPPQSAKPQPRLGDGRPALREENNDRQSLRALISLPTPLIRIESRSADWKNDAEALARVAEILASKPGARYSRVPWAERTDDQRQRVIASLDIRRSIRIDIADYHVCVLDGREQVWFFRTVEADGWSK